VLCRPPATTGRLTTAGLAGEGHLHTPGPSNSTASLPQQVVKRILALDFLEMSEITVDVDPPQSANRPPADHRPLASRCGSSASPCGWHPSHPLSWESAWAVCLPGSDSAGGLRETTSLGSGSHMIANLGGRPRQGGTWTGRWRTRGYIVRSLLDVHWAYLRVYSASRMTTHPYCLNNPGQSWLHPQQAVGQA